MTIAFPSLPIVTIPAPSALAASRRCSASSARAKLSQWHLCTRVAKASSSAAEICGLDDSLSLASRTFLLPTRRYVPFLILCCRADRLSHTMCVTAQLPFDMGGGNGKVIYIGQLAASAAHSDLIRRAHLPFATIQRCRAHSPAHSAHI